MFITAGWVGTRNGGSGAGWTAFSSVILIAAGFVAGYVGANPIGGMAVGFCTVESLCTVEGVLRAVEVGIMRQRIVVANGGLIAVGLVARGRQKT